MMRKWLMSAAAIALFAGCTAQETPVPPEGQEPENPQQKFDELTQEHREQWAETFSDLLPEAQSFAKSRSLFTLEGDATLAQVQGNAEFNVQVEGMMDSTAADPLAQSTIEFSGSFEGQPLGGTVDGIVKVIVANNSIFASLDALNVDIPGVPVSQFMGSIRPIIGQWYGDSLNTLNDMAGAQIDVRSLLENQARGPAQVKEEITEIIRNRQILTMEEALETENGFYRFRTSLNKAELKAAIVEFAQLSNASESDIEELKTDLDESLASVSVNGILALKADEPKYFTYEGTIEDSAEPDDNTEVKASFLENEKTIAFTNPQSGEHMELNIAGENETHTFEITGGSTAEEQQRLISGTKSDDEFMLVVYNPQLDEEVATLTLTKSGDAWSGQITNTQAPDIVVKIERLSFGDTSFELRAMVEQGEETLVNITATYTVNEIDQVDITPPEQYEPFGALMESFMPMFLMGAPGGAVPMPPPNGAGGLDGQNGGSGTIPDGMVPPNPEDLSDEEIQAMMEEIMREMEAEGGASFEAESEAGGEIGQPLTDEEIQALQEAAAEIGVPQQ